MWARSFPLAIVLFLASGAGALAQTAMAALPSVEPSILRVEARGCGTERARSGTGFVWQDAGTAITALHAVELTTFPIG